MIHAFIQSHTTSEYEMSTPDRSKYHGRVRAFSNFGASPLGCEVRIRANFLPGKLTFGL